MTQEEKPLLLRDLCARLTYGVIVDIKYNKEHGSSDRLRICSEGSLMLNTDLIGLCIEEEIHLKPYLRSMSSMTKEEKKELKELHFYYTDGHIVNDEDKDFKPIIIDEVHCFCIIDWLNAHHFDYCGLIDKGLALEAPEGMYNKKEGNT